MIKSQKRLWTLLLLVLLFATNIAAQDYDDEESDEPGARVGRISFLEGDANIKRIDIEEWEKVVENLPLVEGDTIQTESDTKIEIQLDKYSFLRLGENSVLKFTFLADDGIALSLSKGTLGVTLVQFDTKDTYFEVDAPSSTITIQKAGSYRIDAGDEYNKEVRVSVWDTGSARVYSTDSGFSLKSGRTARLFLDGNLKGEWETSANSTIADSFQDWSTDRNKMIAARFQNDIDDNNGLYDDQDIYGVDDLDNYGDWVSIANYGNVWRPNSRATSSYSNWSPYRYGSWRWLPYYGWTWVNHEPWGWATYHYGRWFFHHGRWYWSPHRQYRSGRSWWRPALVYVSYINNSFCWYPVPYGYRYYNYNRRFRNRWPSRNRNNNRNRNKRRGNGNSDRTNTVPQKNVARALRKRTPPFGTVPTTGVVTVPAGQFERRGGGFRNPPFGVATKVLKQKPIVVNSPPLVPERKYNGSKTIRTPDISAYDTKTGAAKRKTSKPLDKDLRRDKIFGNRTPVTKSTTRIPATTGKKSSSPRTGAFERKKSYDSKTSGNQTVLTAPVRSNTTKRNNSSQKRTTQRHSTPVVKPRAKPTYVPRQKQSTRKPSRTVRRNSSTTRKSAPKRAAPKRSSPSRSTQRRSSPTRKSAPTRSAPRRSAPKRKSTPTRSAPKRSTPKKSAPRSKPKSSSRKKTS